MWTISGARNQNYTGESDKLTDFANISTMVSHNINPYNNTPW